LDFSKEGDGGSVGTMLAAKVRQQCQSAFIFKGRIDPSLEEETGR